MENGQCLHFGPCNLVPLCEITENVLESILNVNLSNEDQQRAKKRELLYNLQLQNNLSGGFYNTCHLACL